MAFIPFLIFMIIFIIVLSLLNDVFSLALYDFFLVYVGTNLTTVLDIPTNSLIISELIMGMLILITLWKVVHVGGKARQRYNDMMEEV